MSVAATWSTRANALTLLRLMAAPALAAAVLHGAPVAAATLFAFAVATDLADGWVARRYGEASSFGGFVDHAVDAIFVTAGCAALAAREVLPAPLPFLIALAFTQYVLDSRTLLASGLRASSLGRWNGIAYYGIVAVPLVRDSLGLAWPGPEVVLAAGWLLVGTTLLSMADRWRTWRRARGESTRLAADGLSEAGGD